MTMHRILVATLAATAALTFPLTALAAVTSLDFAAQDMNDTGSVVGKRVFMSSKGNYDTSVRWTAAGGRRDYPQATELTYTQTRGINNSAVAWGSTGDYSGGVAFNVYWTGDEVQTVFGPFGTNLPMLVAIDDAGRQVLVRDAGSGSDADPPATTVLVGGREVVSQANGRLTVVEVASDGSFITTGTTRRVGTGVYYDDPTARRYHRPDGTAVALPEGLIPLAVAPKGWVAARVGDTIQMARLQDTPRGWVRADLPPLAAGGAVPRSHINSNGRIVAQSSAPILSIKVGGAWEDITPLLQQPDSDRMVLTDMNEWGDVIAATGAYKGVLYAIRVPLTGQVQTTASSGGRSARAGLAGKLVTLTGGPVPLTSTLSATGKFSLAVPTGSGYALVAPAGTCVVVANGCQTSIPLAPVTAATKPIALARTTVVNVASFVAAKNGAVRAVRGVATTSVRCAATNSRPCSVTLTLRAGKVSLGTAKVTIAKGKAMPVAIKLTRAATTMLAAKPTVPATATLVVKIGTRSTTIVQALRLVR